MTIWLVEDPWDVGPSRISVVDTVPPVAWSHEFIVGGYDSASDFGGDLAEMLMYTTALNDADRSAVEQYLMQWYSADAPADPELPARTGPSAAPYTQTPSPSPSPSTPPPPAASAWPLAVPWWYVGDTLEHISRPPYFLWNPTLQPWTLSHEDLTGGRGALPVGALEFLRAVPPGQPKAMLPWKVYEDDAPYAVGSASCALYHCVADNIIDDMDRYLAQGCGGAANWTFSGPWWDHGAATVANLTGFAFSAIRDANLTVDYWISDTEKGMSNWNIGSSASDPCAILRWRAIESDPRWPSLLDELVAAGFEELPGQTRDVLLDTVATRAASDNYLVWNAVMQHRVRRYYNISMWQPAVAVFPELQGSDYLGRYWSPSRPIPDKNGHRFMDYGQGSHFGTHQAVPSYGGFNQLENAVDLLVDGRYYMTPYRAFLYDLQIHRSQVLANPAVPVSPWICKKSWAGDAGYVRGVVNTSYWEENIVHMVLSGTSLFNYWNVPSEGEASPDATRLNALLSSTGALVEQYLGHTYSLGGRHNAGLTPMFTSLTNWSAPYVYTGMRGSNGACLWRFSVDTGQLDQASVLISMANPVVFLIRATNETIVFRAAELVVNQPVIEAEAVGFMVSQAECATPEHRNCVESPGLCAAYFQEEELSRNECEVVGASNCPVEADYAQHTFIPDRRPIIMLNTWNGCWPGLCGSSAGVPNGNIRGFHRSWRPDLDPQAAVDELVAQLESKYAVGYRRFVTWLPAGTERNSYMSSSQWWPLSFGTRHALNTTLRQWLAAHPDAEFGPYIGWDVLPGHTPCTLEMEGHVKPTALNDSVRCQLHQTAWYWWDLGAKLIFYDAASGSAELLVAMYQNRSFGQTTLGGEAIPMQRSSFPGATNEERCTASVSAGYNVTYSGRCDAYAPLIEFTANVSWVGSYSFLSCRNYDEWDRWDARTTEVGVLLTGHAPCDGCNSSIRIRGEVNPGPCPYAPLSFDVAVQLHDRGFVLWPSSSTSRLGTDITEAAKRLTNFGVVACAGDFNYDGVVDEIDLSDFRSRWAVYAHRLTDDAHNTLAFWHGDVNNDGCVDGEDVVMFESSVWDGSGACNALNFGPSRMRLQCAPSEHAGCTDPSASNFDRNANTNDGSCMCFQPERTPPCSNISSSTTASTSGGTTESAEPFSGSTTSAPRTDTVVGERRSSTAHPTPTVSAASTLTTVVATTASTDVPAGDSGNSQTQSSNSSDNPGAVVGGVLAAVLVIGLIVAVIVVTRQRRGAQRGQRGALTPNPTFMDPQRTGTSADPSAPDNDFAIKRVRGSVHGEGQGMVKAYQTSMRERQVPADELC